MIKTLEAHEYKIKEIQLEVEVSGTDEGFGANEHVLDMRFQKELNSYQVGNLENSKISLTETGFRTYRQGANTWSQTYQLRITTEI